MKIVSCGGPPSQTCGEPTRQEDAGLRHTAARRSLEPAEKRPGTGDRLAAGNPRG
jgi:hypothetical protein